MGLFSKDTEKKVLKAGGRLESSNGYTPEEKEMAVELVRGVLNGADGFFIAIQTSKPNENQTKAEGMMKIHNVDKTRILEIVMRSIGMSKEEIQQYLMLRTLTDE